MAQQLVNQEVGGRRKGEGFPDQTKKILSDMVPRLSMAKGYLKSVESMHGYFNSVIRDYGMYKKEMGRPETFSSAHKRPSRNQC
jgi:hypothetical protein